MKKNKSIVDDYFIENCNCPLCNSDNNVPYKYEYKEIEGQSIKLGLNSCKNCKMQYISPRLNNRGLTSLYQSYQKSTVSGKYNTESDVSKLEYVAFSGYVRGVLPNGGKILDVGCGIGNLIAELIDYKDYDISGIEFSKVAANKAIKRGFKVNVGSLQDEKYSEQTFDVITLLYVLEHVSNPREVLSEIHRVLKNDGFFLLAVPNYRYLRVAFDNWFSRLLLGMKASLHAEEHLQNFTPKTLRKMLKVENFEIVTERMATPLNTGSIFVKGFKWAMFIALKVLFVFGYNAGGIHIIAKKRNV